MPLVSQNLSSVLQLTAPCVLLLVLAAWSIHNEPRTWTPAELPVAFWSWRTETPTQADVHNAVTKLDAQSLFLRAGQIAWGEGTPYRVRSVFGRLPTQIELHLVYNATPTLLQEFERLNEQSFANAITRAYYEDRKRGADDGVQITGVQLDVDVPTRLLGRYKDVLKKVRDDLPKEAKLSITALPTWMDSNEFADVLDEVDFWSPQFYGAGNPERLDEIQPISAPALIERTVQKAASFEKPFYAGLSGYGCAYLFSSTGEFLSVHGSIDLALVSADPNLELIDARSFASFATKSTLASAEYRYVFRARGNGVTDRLNVHGGDILVLDVPTVESLGIASQIVRANGGRYLKGICIFRLPAEKDPTTLSVYEVKRALERN